MSSDNHRTACARLSTLTSFVALICFFRARRSDSESTNELILIPPTIDFTWIMAESVKKILSIYLDGTPDTPQSLESDIGKPADSSSN